VLGLDQLLDRKPAALSGGQRQRVAMGRAMVREPQAFLMDEPLSNLDAKLRVQMRGELARLRDRLHTTTIYVTHDQIEAMTLGDRVAVMRDGVVQQLDTPNALYQRPANLFVGAFIGSPSMNLVEARVEGREVCFAEYRLPVADRHDLRAYNGRSVVLGMRPSDFEDATVWRDESRATMRVRVDLVEELGSQVNLLFTIAARSGAGDVIAEVVEDAGDSLPVPLVAAEGTSICTACVTAASPARAGGEAEVSVDPALFHYFDPDTGVAVGTATTAPATA
jgi:multiple sugar transport system ATP-binding protein